MSPTVTCQIPDSREKKTLIPVSHVHQAQGEAQAGKTWPLLKLELQSAPQPGGLFCLEPLFVASLVSLCPPSTPS